MEFCLSKVQIILISHSIIIKKTLYYTRDRIQILSPQKNNDKKGLSGISILMYSTRYSCSICICKILCKNFMLNCDYQVVLLHRFFIGTQTSYLLPLGVSAFSFSISVIRLPGPSFLT